MKTMLLMRHAKSSWKDQSLSDHDRPLNKRGRGDAPRMARLLIDKALVPAWVVTSSAKRARKTALAVVEQIVFEGELDVRDELYHAKPYEMLHVVRSLPDHADRILLVGHNPGMEDFVTYLTGGYETMPTSAIARIDVPVTTWSDVAAGDAALVDVWRVKELGDERDE